MMAEISEKNLFPLSSKYNEHWIMANSLGENVLYNLESLCEVLELKPGMRVLDLGCGKAVSAIFLAKEFDVKVWAVDPKISPSQNFQRVREMNCEDCIYPLRLNARNLPFPRDFFDVIIAVDSFMYYGSDMEFTRYITSFLKPGGQIGIVDICFNKDATFHSSLTDLTHSYQEDLYFLHSLQWWYELWNSSDELNVKSAEIVPQNKFIRAEYIRDYENSHKNDVIAEELSKDKYELINIFRMVAKKVTGNYKDETQLAMPGCKLKKL